MYQPASNPGRYFQMLHRKRETELFMCALRLDIFSHLSQWRTPAEVAERSGFDKRSLSLFLNALASIGLLEKSGAAYRNTLQSNEYLDRESPVYLGECILFREQMMTLDHLEQRVKYGPDEIIARHNQGVKVFDFYEAARHAVPEMYSGRVQALLAAVKHIFADIPPKKLLDLGGGCGVQAVELVTVFPGCQGVVFEYPGVADFPLRLVEERGMSESVRVVSGDFNHDDIGVGYDLIIASGIFDFASDTLDALVSKLYAALNADGYLYLVTHQVSDDYQKPPEMILGWLGSHLDGLDILLTNRSIRESLHRHGFRPHTNDDVDSYGSLLQGEFYVKA